MKGMTKFCPRCRESKDISAFGKNRSRCDGLASYCKECYRPYAKDATARYRQTPKGQAAYTARIASGAAAEALRRFQKTPKGRAYHKAWNPERRREISREGTRRHWHRRRDLVANLKQTEWQATLTYFDGRCAYCGALGRMHQDHFIPVTKGGGYTVTNILPACKSCNSSKNDSDPKDWCRPHIYERLSAYLASARCG